MPLNLNKPIHFKVEMELLEDMEMELLENIHVMDYVKDVILAKFV
jgi:hypothetical protein